MSSDNRALTLRAAAAIPDQGEVAVGLRRARPVYTRVQVLGLGLVAATVTAVAVVAVMADPGHPREALSFFGPVAIVALLAAWSAWRFGAWALVVGIVVSLLGGVLLFWTVFGLAAPDSLADFALGVGVALGLLLGIGGGVAALVSGRGGRTETAATPAERWLVRGVLAVVAVALVASATLTALGRTSVDPAVAADATPVEMTGFAFAPAEISVDSADARLVVANTDPFLHDLTVPALNAGVRVAPGSTVTLDLSGAAPGTYAVYCTLHSDPRVDDPAEAGMAAVLVVR